MWNFSLKQQYAAWNMLTEAERHTLLQQQREQRERLIESINASFAIVIDGSRAGQIVSVATGKRVGRNKINALYLKNEMGQVVDIWLRDSRRRELNSGELQHIVDRRGSP